MSRGAGLATASRQRLLEQKKSRSAREACGSFSSPIVKRDNRDRSGDFTCRDRARPIAQGNRVIACHIPASRGGATRANLLDFSECGRAPEKPYTSSEDAKLRALAKAGHRRNEIAAAMYR